MEFSSVPIIVVCCYVIGELYKQIFKKKTEAYRFIPMLLAILGGILAVIIYYTAPEIIFNTDNVWTALGIGIVSGMSATGTNQIIKQLTQVSKTEDQD
jgi:high-affinity Fe2+/Pb2+ permease